MQLSNHQLLSLVYVLLCLVGILSAFFISVVVKDGFQYILFGTISLVLWVLTFYTYHSLPNLFKLIALIPLVFAITPTIQFAGMVGFFDLPIFKKES
jgi:hypothetical protein